MKRDYEKEIEILQMKERVANVEKMAATFKLAASIIETPFIKDIIAKMMLKKEAKKVKKK